MILTGRVVEVSTNMFGDTLTADHALGATVLAVDSTVDFEGVSEVALTDDADVTYLLALLAVDEEASTLTLASGLPVAFPADSFVEVSPRSGEKQALVIVEDGDEAVSARVPHTLYDRMPEGVRDPLAQEAVEVSDGGNGGEWFISDVLGTEPFVDGSYLDPDTLPPSAEAAQAVIDAQTAAASAAAARDEANAAQAAATLAQQNADAAALSSGASSAEAVAAQTAASIAQAAALAADDAADAAAAQALASQQQATASATAAGDSAQAATASQNAATLAQQNAASSATAASTSAGTATAAQTAATNAQAAAVAAQAAADAAAADASLSETEVAAAQQNAVNAQNAAVLAQQNADAAALDAAESATAAAASAAAAQAAQAAAAAAQANTTVTAPTVTPEIDSVTGLPSSLVVLVNPARPSDELEYHLSTTAGFVPVLGAAATLVIPRTKSTVASIATLPDGGPLLPDVIYFVSVIAVNGAGQAPPSAPVGNDLDPTAVSRVVAAQLVAGMILAGTITVGNITINPDTGITIKQPGGNVIHFPANGTDYAEITGHLSAATLAVLGNMSIDGAAQINGTMTLANGIVAPQTAPLLSSFWPSTKVDNIDTTYGEIFHGLTERLSTVSADDGTKDANGLVCTMAFYGPGIRTFGKEDGSDAWPYYDLESWRSAGDTAQAPQFLPWGGITTIGNRYYVFGQDNNRAGAWYVYVLDRNFAKIGETLFSTGAAVVGRPRIGRDEAGNYLLVYTPASTKTLSVQRRTTTHTLLNTYQVASAAQNPTGVAVALNFSGISEGIHDLGGGATPRFYIGVQDSKKVFAYTATNSTTIAKDSARDFSTAGVGTKGLVFDRTDALAGVGRFLTLDPNGLIHRYSAFHSTGTFVSQGTFVDLDAGGTGTHETAPSPASTAYTATVRAFLRATAQPAPDAANTNPTEYDKANRVRIYIGAGGATPTLQVTPAAGVRVGEFDTLIAGSTAPAITTNFAAAGFAPGAFSSVATRPLDGNRPLTFFDGAGGGRADALVPVGVTLPYFGTTQPAGIEWLLCNGQTFLEATHPDLAALLALQGAVYVVSGTAPNRTMKVPDLRDRFISGAGTTRPLGGTPGGADTVTMPDHTHSVPAHNHFNTFGLDKTSVAKPTGSGGGNVIQTVNLIGGVTQRDAFESAAVTGTNPAISNVPKFIAANFIMKT